MFALTHLLYCAHCERIATEQNNSGLRARLIGWNKQGKLRYRHSESNRCDCQTKSVFVDVIEQDFVRLVNVLDVKREALDMMANLAIQSRYGGDSKGEADFENERQTQIAKHRRALKNNLLLFQDGEIDADEYYRQKDLHERQIATWESRTTDREKITFELTMCVELVKRLKQFWDVSSSEDQQLLARSLFDEIVYDLDEKKIIDFKVKSWAEPFLTMRAALYEEQMGENEKSCVLSAGSFVDPNGKELEHLSSLNPLLIEFLQCIAFPQNAQFALLETS